MYSPSRVGDLADIAVFIAAPHLEGLVHVAIVLGVGVDLAGFFDGFNEFDGLCHGLAGQHLTEHVAPGFEQTDGKRSVLIGIVARMTASMSCLKKSSKSS